MIGANLLASASREQMAYTVDVLKTHVPEAVELLADAVLNPKFELQFDHFLDAIQAVSEAMCVCVRAVLLPLQLCALVL